MDFRTNQTQRAYVKSAQYDAGLRAYMLKVYNLMASALAITGLVAFFASTQAGLMQAIYGTALQWVVMLAPLGIVIYLSSRMGSMTKEQAQGWFYGYAAVMGLSLSYIFLAYTGASVARTFFVTAASYGALSLYGYTTKKDLSAMGSFLFMGVFGILIASLVNIFLASSALQFAVSVAGVLIFAGLTAYDTQKIKNSYYMTGGDARVAIMGALQLYLDFLNLFLFMLQFMGNRK